MNTITCTCGSQLDAPLPDLQAVNHPLFSQILALHPEGITCANCGVYYVAAIGDAQVAWVWAKAERPVDASRIIQPNGLGLTH